MACPDFPLWHLDTGEKKWPGFKEEENSCWREQPRAGGRGDLLRVFIPRQPRGYRSCSALIHPLCPRVSVALPEPSKPGSSCGIRPRCHLLSSPCPALSWDRAMAWLGGTFEPILFHSSHDPRLLQARPTWPWALPGVENPRLPLEIHSRASLPSQGRIYPKYPIHPRLFCPKPRHSPSHPSCPKFQRSALENTFP